MTKFFDFQKNDQVGVGGIITEE